MRAVKSAWLWFFLSIAAAAIGYFWIVFSQPALPLLQTDNGISTGQLEITSSPSGASIDVDGQATQRQTPSTVTLSGGKHKVSLTLEGYAVKEQDVIVARNKTTNFFSDLTQ